MNRVKTEDLRIDKLTKDLESQTSRLDEMDFLHQKSDRRFLQLDELAKKMSDYELEKRSLEGKLY